MHEEISARVENAIRERVFPGVVVGIVRNGGEREMLPFGRFTYEAGSPEVRVDTTYDVASVTKSISTASLALQMISERKLRLDEKVAEYLPELQNDYGATITDLLTYRVHGSQLSKLRLRTFEEIRTHVFEKGFDGPPAESVYTNLPAFLLGLVIERVEKSSLPALAHERLFGPLAMTQTTFFPSPSDCAPTEIDERGEVCGLPHDESAYVFARASRAAGHAGLFSTAPDLLNFIGALLEGKLRDVVKGAMHGRGWQIKGEFLGAHPDGRFGKTGFTGTSVVCDMQKGIGLVILSNRTFPKRPPDMTSINAFRRDIADIVLI
ncbi:MAG: beta-lactamase family protein [Patescibacteria group bacterium]|nr:beta-lactamase family protein [Patescibacteria group bacterium]